MWQAAKYAVRLRKTAQSTAVFMFNWAAEFHLQVKVFSANRGKSV